jgi:hypothetical protein
MTHRTLFPVPDLDAPGASAALDPLIRAASAGRFEPLDPWPYPPGPRGPILLADRSPAHGAFVDPSDDDLLLLVANNGWPIDVRRCPGPNPGRLPMLNPTNSWVSQQATLVGAADGFQVVLPDRAAIDRVIARDKPLALAETDDRGEAEAWQALAASHGLGCRVEEFVFRECGDEQVWFVSVARTERFDELVDLAAVQQYYERALPAAGASHLLPGVGASLAALAASRPTEFLDRTDALVSAPFGGDLPDGCPAEVTGVVLGYWPPTTVRLMLSVVGDTYTEPPPEIDLRGYDTARYTMTAALLDDW